MTYDLGVARVPICWLSPLQARLSEPPARPPALSARFPSCPTRPLSNRIPQPISSTASFDRLRVGSWRLPVNVIWQLASSKRSMKQSDRGPRGETHTTDGATVFSYTETPRCFTVAALCCVNTRERGHPSTSLLTLCERRCIYTRIAFGQGRRP